MAIFLKMVLMISIWIVMLKYKKQVKSFTWNFYWAEKYLWSWWTYLVIIWIWLFLIFLWLMQPFGWIQALLPNNVTPWIWLK